MDFGLIVVVFVVLIGFRFYSECEWSVGSIYMEKGAIKMGNESVASQWKMQSKYLNAVIKTIFYLPPWHALQLLHPRKSLAACALLNEPGLTECEKWNSCVFRTQKKIAIWCLSHGLDLIGRTERSLPKKMAFGNALEIDAIINKLNVSREFPLPLISSHVLNENAKIQFVNAVRLL